MNWSMKCHLQEGDEEEEAVGESFELLQQKVGQKSHRVVLGRRHAVARETAPVGMELELDFPIRRTIFLRHRHVFTYSSIQAAC